MSEYLSEYSRAYYQKNKEKVKTRQQKWRKKNKEKWNEITREYYWKNVDKLRPIIAARQRKYNQSRNPRILSDNPTAVYQREWRVNFKKLYGVSWNQIYRYGKNALTAVKKANRKCAKCGSDENLVIHHKDGNGRNKLDKKENPNNSLSNLIVLCRSCHSILHGGLARK
jgi:ribosomal protein S27AE